MTAVSDPAPASASSRSSLLYAFGKLTAETANHAQEIARLREAQEALPARVIAGLAPQLQAMQGTIAQHDTRIGTLERRQWFVWGGGVTTLALIGYVFKLIDLPLK